MITWFAGKIGRDRLKRDRHLSTWVHEAPYGVFPAKDGHFLISNNKNTTTANLGKVLDSRAILDLGDADRYGQRDLIAREIAVGSARLTLAEIEMRLTEVDIWWAPIKYYDELLEEPQAVHYQMFRDVALRGQKVKLVNHPNKYAPGPNAGSRHRRTYEGNSQGAWIRRQ